MFFVRGVQQIELFSFSLRSTCQTILNQKNHAESASDTNFLWVSNFLSFNLSKRGHSVCLYLQASPSSGEGARLARQSILSHLGLCLELLAVPPQAGKHTPPSWDSPEGRGRFVRSKEDQESASGHSGREIPREKKKASGKGEQCRADLTCAGQLTPPQPPSW